MYSYRYKKIRNQTQKYLEQFANNKLILSLLNSNQKCIQQVNKYHFKKAEKIIAQLKSDLEAIQKSRQRNTIRSLCLNTEAYYFQRQNEYDQALRCIQQAQQIQLINEKPNQIRVLYQAKLEKINKLYLLEKQLFSYQRNKRKKIELKLMFSHNIISSTFFYNIAAELSHLKEINQALGVFRQGFAISNKILGPRHKLTLILQEIIRQQRNSMSKQKSQLNLNGSQYTINNSHLNNLNLMSPRSKELQLKKIYYKKKKSFSLADKNKKQKTKHYNFYLKSLQKLQNFNRFQKAQGQKRRTRTDVSENISTVSQIKKNYPNSTQSKVNQQKKYNQRIKDIILNNKHSNKNNPFNGINKSVQLYPSLTVKESVQLVPLIPKKQSQNKITIQPVSQEVQTKQNCQLI